MMVNVAVRVSRQISTKVRQRATLRNTGRHLTKYVLHCLSIESRFYAVLSKAASKWPSVKATPDRSPGTEMAKRPRKCSKKHKGSKWRSYAWQVHNERIHRQK